MTAESPLPTHVSVMLDEVLEAMSLQPGMVVVDGTLGLAGHSVAIAKKIAPGGLLIGIDWDQAMLARAEARLKAEADGVTISLHHADYRALPDCVQSACARYGRQRLVDAILLDLGLNNAQIEDALRGISFRQNGPLDMRMDVSKGVPLSEILKTISARDLEQILWDLGDERWARQIAKVIVERRKTQEIETTDDLVDCIQAAVPAAKRDKRLHVATRSFQALRIYINGELDELQEAIESAARCLKPGGTLVTLAYHSGEDRAVKHAFKSLCQGEGFTNVFKKPLRPSEEEVARNPKSRSAVMRVLRRNDSGEEQ